MVRPLIHYALAAVIIPFYGISVCPFIEGLDPIWTAAPIVVLLATQFLLRRPLWNLLVAPRAIEKQSKGTFTLELGLFLASAVLLTLFNTVAFGFPVGSGLKVMVGIGGLGFFAAIDITLMGERALLKRLKEECEGVAPSHTPEREGGLPPINPPINPEIGYFPLTSKMAIFASTSVLLIVAVFTLIINHDLNWLIEISGEVPLREGRTAVIKEFIFVLGVVLPHTLNIILSYSSNFSSFLSSQNSVLKRTTGGDYSGRVPVGTTDEFGVMAHHTNIMVDTILKRTKEVRQTRDLTIHALASLAETRDNETGAHIMRTQRYVWALATHLKENPRFSATLGGEEGYENIDLLFKSAPLHDIGKVGIPDSILLKPGKLSDDEFKVMRTHPTIGGASLRKAEESLGGNSFLNFAIQIAESHHEKYDGTGYPGGLKGDEIPVGGRLMALADVYDALISKRAYKEGFSHEEAVRIITEGDGRTKPGDFDPDVLAAFKEIEGDFKRIAEEFKNE